MLKRVIDVSNASYLHVKNKQLLLDQQGKQVAAIPIEDIAVLILEHPAIVLTQQLIIACQQNNTALVFCDDKHLPYSIILPVSEGNSLHSKILRQQIQLKKTMQKRLWQQIVVHKLQQQALTLKLNGIENKTILRLSEKVKSGDSQNHEAQAAKQYWSLLMGKTFRRNPEQDGVNAMLNYGYSIMRALVARALVGAGLHPALGLHHSNQYNGLCLADDIMEPFRPWVDFVVSRLYQRDGVYEINQHSKRCLLALMAENVQWRGNSMPLMVACHYLCANLKEAYAGTTDKLDYPQWPVSNRN